MHSKILKQLMVTSLIGSCLIACDNSAETPCSPQGVNKTQCSLDILERSNWTQVRDLSVTPEGGEEISKKITVAYAFENTEAGSVWKRLLKIETEGEVPQTTVEAGIVESITANQINLVLIDDICFEEPQERKIEIPYKRNGATIEFNPREEQTGLFGALANGIAEGIGSAITSMFELGFSYLSASVFLTNPDGIFESSEWPKDLGEAGCFTLNHQVGPYKADTEIVEALLEIDLPEVEEQ